MERKSSKEYSAYFLWTNERFRKLNGEALGLFWDNQGSEVLEEISGHSVLYGQGKYVFKWKIMYYWRLTNVLYILTSAWKKKYKMCQLRSENYFMLNFAADFPFVNVTVTRIAFKD